MRLRNVSSKIHKTREHVPSTSGIRPSTQLDFGPFNSAFDKSGILNQGANIPRFPRDLVTLARVGSCVRLVDTVPLCATTKLVYLYRVELPSHRLNGEARNRV